MRWVKMDGNRFVRFNPETWQEEPLLWIQNCKITSTYDWIAIFWEALKIDIWARYWDIEDANGWVAILWNVKGESFKSADTICVNENVNMSESLFSLQFWGHLKAKHWAIEKTKILGRHTDHFEMFNLRVCSVARNLNVRRDLVTS